MCLLNIKNKLIQVNIALVLPCFLLCFQIELTVQLNFQRSFFSWLQMLSNQQLDQNTNVCKQNSDWLKIVFQIYFQCFVAEKDIITKTTFLFLDEVTSFATLLLLFSLIHYYDVTVWTCSTLTHFLKYKTYI